MRNRVERLRIWLLGSAGFLLLVIAAFLVYARSVSHHRFALPNRLGVDIVRETDGYTYSQSLQGKTVFTIHAAKALEHTDRTIALHDVSIALYGEKQDRNDCIYGDEFEYDEKGGVVRATGVVHLDLKVGDAVGGAASGPSANEGSVTLVGGKASVCAAHEEPLDAKVLHVTTSGLVYMEKLGVAATSESIEFQSGAMAGHATGADYSRDSGVLMLHSAVQMSGVVDKRAVVVTASTAYLDNRNQEDFLTHAKYVSQGQTVQADHATLHTRPDGTLARVEAQGNVTTEANGATAVSQRADVVLNSKSRPESAVLAGGVLYTSEQPLRQVRGQADATTIAFDAQGQMKQAVFTGAIHITERTRATVAAREPWSTRDLTAARVEAALRPTGAGRSQLRDVQATGSARLTEKNNGSLANTRGEGTTELSADDIKAHLIDGGNARQPRLETVAARGHTLLHEVASDGTEQISSGDTLNAKFRSGNSLQTASSAAAAAVGRSSHRAAGTAKSAEDVDDLQSAIQQGHVTLLRRAPSESGGKGAAKTNGRGSAQQDVERATADQAVYDGDLNRITLTGGVQMSDADSALWANQVALDRETGDARAVGAVKVNSAQDNSSQTGMGQSEPAHILAERAELIHATGVATFHGSPVRMWQGGSQVQAPVIELARAQQRLVARGEMLAGESAAVALADPVHTILVSAGKARPGAAKAGATPSGTPAPEVMRIASRGLTYSGNLHRAEFTGGVRVETVDGTIRANEAAVFLRQTTAANSGTAATASHVGDAAPSLAGNVERMVATGQIEIEQSGRRATGERLVYTASDRLFVLTGEGKAQAKLVDAARGTITGAALSFNSGDDHVVVSDVAPGATGAAAGQRVRTETHAGKDATMGKRK